ncbi:hypothetical protein KC711_00190 [Candidatus Peregrinibacteria bacterium]|nr:hypothetical protein [Candidatus Peregrinibacteria bacterium]MCB9804724.1 hypothetical protein [Candidatus Peribacteria bacterium]
MTDLSKKFDDLYITCRYALEVQGFDISDYGMYDYFFIQQNKDGDIWIFPISEELFLSMKENGFSVVSINADGRPTIEGENSVHVLH